MPRYSGSIDVGDVLVVAAGGGLIGEAAEHAIELGARLEGDPDDIDHVVVVHHRDGQGQWWGVQAQPGGVGWAPLDVWLTAPHTYCNNEQPKTQAQRLMIATLMEQMLDCPYDWRAISSDAREALHASWGLVAPFPPGAKPLHVVCSSLASWGYERVGLTRPKYVDRRTTPGQWAKFIVSRGWDTRLAPTR